MSTDLELRPEQTNFDEQQLSALSALGVEDAPPGDVAMLFHIAKRSGLDPFARQIYLIGRLDKKTGKKKWTIQTGIDGFRVLRDRTKLYLGHTTEWCGPDGKWRDVWLEKRPPSAARVAVHVKDRIVPAVGIANWSEYAATFPDGNPMALWAKMPSLMLAKCAEALAYRQAFPQDFSNIYLDEEMQQADVGQDGVPSVTTVQEPQKPRQAPKQVAASHAAPKRAPVPEPSEEQQAAIVEFADAITETDSVNALRNLHHEADQRHLLAYPTREGVRLNDLFHARKAYLQQQDAEDLPPALDGIEDDGGAV